MKTINLRITNIFLDEEVCTVVMPFDPYRAMDGFYSGWWRDVKIEIANAKHIDKAFIKLKIWMSAENGERMRVSFPSGTKLNTPSPFKMSETDWKIIDLHIEAARLATTK